MNMARVRKICPEVLRKLTDPVMCTRGAVLNCPSFYIKVQGQPLRLTVLRPLTLILPLPPGTPPGEEGKTVILQGRSFQQEEQGGLQHLRVGRECEGQVVPLIYDAQMPLQGRWRLQFPPGFQMELNYPKWRGDPQGILTRDTRTRDNSANCPRRSSLLSIKPSLEKLRPRIGSDGNCLLLDFQERKTSWI